MSKICFWLVRDGAIVVLCLEVFVTAFVTIYIDVNIVVKHKLSQAVVNIVHFLEFNKF